MRAGRAALGSREEGAYVAEGLAVAFRTTLGALAWLGMMDIARHVRIRKRSRTH